jgi:hypothetical protein
MSGDDRIQEYIIIMSIRINAGGISVAAIISVVDRISFP